MMTRHPGGLANTGKMLDKIPWNKGDLAIDLGAGAGESVCYMRELGLRAIGVDIAPGVISDKAHGMDSDIAPDQDYDTTSDLDSGIAIGGDLVIKCDFLNLPYNDGSFDIALSQCAFFVSGDVKRAVSEASRILKREGHLLIADLDDGRYREIIEGAGIRIIHYEDMTPAWREYYIEAIWNDDFCCNRYRKLAEDYGRAKLGYSLYIGEKKHGDN